MFWTKNGIRHRDGNRPCTIYQSGYKGYQFEGINYFPEHEHDEMAIKKAIEWDSKRKKGNINGNN